MDICILAGDGRIWLVGLGDKRPYAATISSTGPAGDLEAGVIAAAIAAFDQNNNNKTRLSASGLPFKVLAGVVMTGTTPTFYNIPITGDLSCCLCGCVSGYNAHYAYYSNSRSGHEVAGKQADYSSMF
ncbi:hypothetical protein BU17DRAFT_70425 [Hysterangium stoloniferum]|nr:hypothetical protein BU17DRAFT_70425 [Hysterangium stoloniferum]